MTNMGALCLSPVFTPVDDLLEKVLVPQIYSFYWQYRVHAFDLEVKHEISIFLITKIEVAIMVCYLNNIIICYVIT